MKRRNLILGFVIVALLLIGVGYAALSDSLSIKAVANAAPSDDDFNVNFIADDPANPAVNITDDLATVTVSLSTAQPSTTVELTVKNESEKQDLIANLGAISVGEKSGNSAYFTVTAEWKAGADMELAYGETAVIVVTFTLAKTPSDNVSATYNFSFEANASTAN